MGVTLACERATRGTCPRCGVADQLIYETDHFDTDACPDCIRRAASRTHRVQMCDTPGHENRPAWRNPKTRRDEYFCGQCHAESGDGVVLNKWALRVSTPLNIQSKAQCEARNVPGTKDCRGEIKPRGKTGALLCNAHAGKTSSEAPYENRM